MIPDIKSKTAIRLIEEGKACEQQVTLLNQQIDSLDSRMEALKSVIVLHNEKDSVQALVDGTYMDEIASITTQKELATNEVSRLLNNIKRLKRKVTILIGIGAVGIAAAAYLLIFK